MTQLKIAFIKKKFSIYGGAENYLNTLVKELKNKEHEIHIFSAKWQDCEGVKFHKIKILNFGSFLSNLSFDLALKSKFKNFNFDCIISFERTTFSGIDIYRASDGCHKAWLEIRSKIEPLRKKISFQFNPLHNLILKQEKEVLKNAKKIIVNSYMVKRQISNYYPYTEPKIEVIYNGVDTERFNLENKQKWKDDLREKLKISKEEKVLLFVGSDYKRKGLKTVLEALKLLKNKPYRLLVIGRAKNDEYYKLSEKLGIRDKILFLGTQKEMEKYYSLADIFALPTIYDPFSNATVEAMASAVPVITTKNNGASEIIENGKEGFVLDDFLNSEELAEKIELVSRNIEKMGINARDKAEKFSIKMATNKILSLIESL